jgi:hypothetical protein
MKNPKDLAQHILIDQGRNKVKGFSELIEKFKKNLSVLGRAKSNPNNANYNIN